MRTLIVFICILFMFSCATVTNRIYEGGSGKMLAKNVSRSWFHSDVETSTTVEAVSIMPQYDVQIAIGITNQTEIHGTEIGMGIIADMAKDVISVIISLPKSAWEVIKGVID